MANLLQHLISNEVGTSAFLGTLLDPRNDDPVFAQARIAIAHLLKRHGIEVSSPEPTVVELEYLSIDLVAVWVPWIFLIENKVASASVTRGQLRDYYSVCLLHLARNGFLKHAGEAVSQKPLCFIYLTPTPYTGMVEFETLELDSNRTDAKIHLAWSELLDCLTPIVGKIDEHLRERPSDKAPNPYEAPGGQGVDEAENLKIRADLMIELTKLIEAQKLTQAAAKLLGVTQPRVSDLKRGKIDRFSVDSLIEMLGHAGACVSVVVSQRSQVA